MAVILRDIKTAIQYLGKSSVDVVVTSSNVEHTISQVVITLLGLVLHILKIEMSVRCYILKIRQ